MSARIGIVLLCWLLMAGDRPASTRPFFQRGVNFTAEWPDTYSSAKAREILESLPRYGVTAIALVPYGFTPLGQPVVRFSGTRNWERDTAIETLAAAAHAKGIRVLLKPQIWTREGAPINVDFSKPEDRKQYFDQYRLYLEHYAQLASKIHADLFSVGVEFTRLSKYDQEWRSLIAGTRRIYSGPLVYSANWGAEFETVKFWDALDYIGLNNYYPLPDSLDASDVVRKVEAVQKRFGKPVIFPEAGYSSVEGAHREPWAEPASKISLDHQVRCYDALLKAFYNKPWFQGVYWWKVGSNGFGGPSDPTHTPWRKPAMELIAKWYLHGGRG